MLNRHYSRLDLACGTPLANKCDGPRKLQLWEERHSRTDEAGFFVMANFDIQEGTFPYGYKHMLEFNSGDEAKFEALAGRPITQFSMPVLLVVKNPYDWIKGMNRRPHHAP